MPRSAKGLGARYASVRHAPVFGETRRRSQAFGKRLEANVRYIHARPQRYEVKSRLFEAIVGAFAQIPGRLHDGAVPADLQFAVKGCRVALE